MIKKSSHRSWRLLGTTISMEYLLTLCPRLHLEIWHPRKKQNSSSNWMLECDPHSLASLSTYITIERHKRITNAQTNLPIYTARFIYSRSPTRSLLFGRLIKKVIVL